MISRPGLARKPGHRLSFLWLRPEKIKAGAVDKGLPGLRLRMAYMMWLTADFGLQAMAHMTLDKIVLI